MKIKSIVLIGAVLSVFVAAATAQNRTGSPSPFTVHDLDHDGMLDHYEYGRMFSRWKQHRLHTGKPEFSDIDEDADGYITEEELIKTLNRQLRLQRRVRARERRWSSDEAY
jgi:Ca2+-binding EF-hand superfamily protein